MRTRDAFLQKNFEACSSRGRTKQDEESVGFFFEQGPWLLQKTLSMFIVKVPEGWVVTCSGAMRGKSGLRKGEVWVTPSRGNSRESATERIPPMSVGKGEMVR